MFSKDKIREQMQAQRRQMSSEMVKKSSVSCISQLFTLNEYQEAKTILVYASTRNEVDTRPIVEDALAHNKVVGMPVSYQEGAMEFYSVFDWSDLKPGRFGILEPPADILVEAEDALILVPAVAYDRRKNRIGHGGGYYDRYMQRHPDLYKIGLAYEYQIVDAFEPEEYDEPVDLIVTDTQIII